MDTDGQKKRSYVKRNTGYWEAKSAKMSSGEQTLHSQLKEMASTDSPDFEFELSGSPFYETSASYSRTSTSSGNSVTRSSVKGVEKKADRFGNIEMMSLPFNYNDRVGVSTRESVVLCQKAYANVAVFRNTIDLMSEFSNSPIFIDGGSQKSRDLLNKWLKRIKVWKLKDQFFREYYRSGNVFFYKIEAYFSDSEIKKIKTVYSEAAKVAKIPSRYILLNPADMTCTASLSSGTSNYKKALSKFEVMELKNRTSEYAKSIYESLPKEVRDQIDSKSINNYLYIDLDTSFIRPVFYKKQDYEPFAIPFGYPVLDDINWKLELKKIDQAVSRTVENIILLVTMGNEPDKGGINYKHLGAIQSLFSSEKTGRVLVSDYTTKAEFVIPDLSKILGPEKYQIVNEDIMKGLQNVLFDDGKYSNNEIKTKIFIKRLDDARNEFLQFLQSEAEDVCEEFGLRDCPQIKFVKTDMSDSASLQKVTTRLIELGILHPEDGIEAIRTHRYPEREEMRDSQERLVAEREKGWYNPLVGGVPMVEGAESNVPTKIPAKDNGRPSTAKTYSKEAVIKFSSDLKDFKISSEAMAKKIFGKKRLSSEQKQTLYDMCEAICFSTERENWEDKLARVIKKEATEKDLEVLDGIKEISFDLDLDFLQASMLYHSSK